MIMNKEEKEKYPERICRVCGKKTEQVFNINLKMAYVCRDCEYKIVKQSVIDIYQ